MIVEFLGNFWGIFVAILALVMYKFIFRVFFGLVIVPEDKIGLVTKKFVLFGANKELKGGRIIATNGEAGYQATPLASGLHWGKWVWQYSVHMQSFITIPAGSVGLVSAKDGVVPQTGRILGRRVDCDNYQDAEKFLNSNGQKGRQSAFIPNGVYKINTFLFDVSSVAQVHIQDNMVGIITTLDGEPLDTGQIAGKSLQGDNSHNNFQDFDKFLEMGGNRGLQQQVILSGTYNLNPWAVNIEEVQMTEISIGTVGVVISYVGEDGIDVTGDTFKHGNLVSRGQKGVWAEPLGPGKYPINKYTNRIEIVPTTNLVLNWASARTESHNLDKNLCTITVRSKDGFPFNLDVSQIIHIPMNEAPKVIARFGNMNNLVSQVLEPTIGNYFRNSAQDSDVIAFLTTRKERQESAKSHISSVLEEYNVHAVDTLIGDITPPESLMKTLTDRKIAQEQETTYETQRKAQIQRQTLEKETAIADMQAEVVKADQGVQIAERHADASVKKATGDATSVKISAEANAEAIKVNANAEASKTTVMGVAIGGAILVKGQSEAEAYRLAVSAMGKENFTAFKVTEEIGKNNIKIMPDLLINGGGSGGNGSIDGLLGLQVLEMMGTKMKPLSSNTNDLKSEDSKDKE
mgnify:CR=1 FL=1|jgi:uncharacterized membrane protein YqiK